MSTAPISRRTFLQTSAIFAGGIWLVGCSESRPDDFNILTRSEAEIMDILADTVIPPDDDPGGKQAGVTSFIDQQLDKHLHRDKEIYKTCLPALNKSSESDFGSLFIRLDENRRTDYLTAIESGEYDDRLDKELWGNFMPSSFFNTVRDHCMMGYYGHPRHGGNKDYPGYKLLGLSIEQSPTQP